MDSVTTIKDFLSWSASQVGHECDRNLGYSVLDYPKDEPTERKKRTMEYGHVQEKLILEELRKEGVEFTNSVLDEEGQTELKTEVRLKKRPVFYILAHPDAIYQNGLTKIVDSTQDMESGSPIEVKGLNRFYWERIYSPRHMMSKHYIQLQMQMLGAEASHGLYVARNKDTGESKHFIIPRDQETIKATLKRLGLLTTTILEYRRLPQASWQPGSERCRKPITCPWLGQCLKDHKIQETQVEAIAPVLDVDDRSVLAAALRLWNVNKRLKKLKVEKNQRRTELANVLKKLGALKMVVGPFMGELSSYPKRTPDRDTVKRLMDEGTIPFETTQVEKFVLKMWDLKKFPEDRVVKELLDLAHMMEK